MFHVKHIRCPFVVDPGTIMPISTPEMWLSPPQILNSLPKFRSHVCFCA